MEAFASSPKPQASLLVYCAYACVHPGCRIEFTKNSDFSCMSLIVQCYLQVITHIMKFLSVSDRKEAALVNKTWYEASTDPVLLRDTIYLYHSSHPDSQEWWAEILKRKAQHVVLDNIDTCINTKSLILRSCSEITENLLSLSLKGSDLSEKTFITILSGCHNLRTLDISCCNSLFMTGALLSKDADRNALTGVLDNLMEINLSSVRYLSDATFNRLMSISPNVESVHLAGNQILFHSSAFCSGESQSCGNTAVLTFANFLQFLKRRSSKVKMINLSRTSIHDEGLTALASVAGLQLRELYLVACRDISDEGIVELSKKQVHLEVLSVNQCADVTDISVASLCHYAPELRKLLLADCRRVTDISIAKIQKLTKLERLDISSCYTITSRGLILGLCKNTLTNLRELILNCCSSVKDSFVAELCNILSQLSLLDLSSCSITDKSMHYISKYLTKLRTLRLAWCKDISDNGLLGIVDVTDPRLLKAENVDLCRCTRKRHTQIILDLPKKGEAEPLPVPPACESKLHVNVHKLQDWVPVSNIRTLHVLDLTSCHRVTDAAICQVMTFPELKSVHLSMCPSVTDESLRAIGLNIRGLEELHLSQCSGITDAGMAYISRRMWRLRTLDISKCDTISNKSLEAIFTYAKRLHNLDVSLCNNVTIDMIEMMENNMPHLRNVKKRLISGSGLF